MMGEPMPASMIEMPPDGLGAKIDRLDRNMRQGFAESRAELNRKTKELDTKIDSVRVELDRKINGVRVELDTKMDARFAGLASELGKIYRLAIISLCTVVAAVIGAVFTAVATGLVL